MNDHLRGSMAWSTTKQDLLVNAFCPKAYTVTVLKWKEIFHITVNAFFSDNIFLTKILPVTIFPIFAHL